MAMHAIVESVTARIIERSATRRRRYLELIAAYDATKPARVKIAEANRAHGAAGCDVQDKIELLGGSWPSIGIVTAYNDMLSAHAPYERYPEIIRKAARDVGAIAQVAGGVPAMCDGVTQGFEGMELSLFSRDVIALSTAVSLSHATFDAALLLGICDKIVPGLADRRAALSVVAVHFCAGRADAFRLAKQGEGRAPAIVRGRQDRPRRAAAGRS
jgi:phosphogluconate dehydratase